MYIETTIVESRLSLLELSEADKEEIDLTAIHTELTEIDRTIQAATAKHNEFLKELGMPLLP